MRGLKIVDVPMDPDELVVDMDLFRKMAPLVRPKLVALGASMTLFPFPLREMSEIVAEWGGKIFFDGAHQIGLIAGGQFQDPLREGAAVLTGSAGKTFSGPQSGIIVWDDPGLTQPITQAIFPVLAATHQVNRVAALAVAAAEMIEFGQAYMAQIVRNAQALGAALEKRGIPVLGAHKGYTRTHQVIADVRGFGGGLDVAHLLARANIVTNKNLLPGDTPGGLGPAQRAAHGHHRSHTLRHARTGNGPDRRLHGAPAGRKAIPRPRGRRRDRIPRGVPDVVLRFRPGLAAAVRAQFGVCRRHGTVLCPRLFRWLDEDY